MKSKTIIIVAGPTAVGKTSFAVDLARYLHTDIISADSRQCYRELTIGVAKPSPDQLNDVKHYFINSHSIHEEVTAASFEEYALQAAAEIFTRSDTAVMVGGTGLYIKAFCQGLDEIPAVGPEIRASISKKYAQYGLSWLQEQVRENDPEYYSTGETLNPQRLMRALEVMLGTGESIRHFQQRKPIKRDFNIIPIGLHLPKEQLYQQIDFRVDEMIRHGLLNEANSVYAFRNLPALRTVGYSELFDYMDGTMSLAGAIALIKKNTRQYAKRQLTWFRRDTAITWYSPSDKDEIISLISQRVKS